MGYDKYGLDWNVWGTKSKGKSSSSNPLLDGIGKGWGQTKKSVVEEDEDAPKQTGPITAKLVNAAFLPDSTTDFNKPCKVKVEIESKEPVKTPVTFALWGRYNGQEYNLQHEAKADPKDNVATVELKLFYVDPYYNDAVVGKKPDITVDYIAKCTMKGAKGVDSDPLTLPIKGMIVLSFEDDNVAPIEKVKVTLDSGAVYFSNAEGKVEIPQEGDCTEVNVVKIELPGEYEETTTTVPGGTSPETPVTNVTDGTTETAGKTVLVFKGKDDKTISGVKITLASGESFSSDSEGKIEIPQDASGGELTINTIEMPG